MVKLTSSVPRVRFAADKQPLPGNNRSSLSDDELRLNLHGRQLDINLFKVGDDMAAARKADKHGRLTQTELNDLQGKLNALQLLALKNSQELLQSRDSWLFKKAIAHNQNNPKQHKMSVPFKMLMNAVSSKTADIQHANLPFKRK